MFDLRNKNLFYGCLAVCFVIFPSQLALNISWQIAVKSGVVIFVSLGFLLSLQYRLGVPRIALPVLVLLGALLIASAFSSYLNNWIRPFAAYIAFIGVITISLVLIGRLRNPTFFVRVIVFGTAITAMILVAASLVLEPFSFYRYQGIFNNPNSMGWFTAGVCVLLIGALYENRLSWSRTTKKFLWAVLMGHLFLLLACNSRAGLVALLAVVLLFMTFRFADAVSITHIRLSALHKFINFVSLFLLLGGCFYFAGFIDLIVEKFTVKAARGDVSAERLDAWLTSLSHWTWFGLGPDYSMAIGRGGEATGHSVYISQLTKYGLIPTVLFVTILLYIWFCAFYSIRNRGTVAPTLMAVLTGFLVHAAFETGAATPGIWLAILLFAALLAESRIQEKSSKFRVALRTNNRKKFG